MTRAHLRSIGSPALVVPTTRAWSTQMLGTGSVVRVREPDEANPLGVPDEIYVDWADVAGREASGYLATTTQLKAAPSHAPLTNVRGDLILSPLDRLRDLVAMAQARDPSAHWTLESWCCIFGGTHLEELYNVVRELGGKVPNTADVETVIRRTLRLILHKEVDVSEVKEAATATATKTKSAKKASAKKSAAKSDAPARSMARTTGNTLVPLLEKAGGQKEALSIAKKLAGDEKVTKTQLTTLRDAVNEAAGAAREAKQEKLASQLSSANRLVRRLARQA